jgi:hypothetical protein
LRMELLKVLLEKEINKEVKLWRVRVFELN